MSLTFRVTLVQLKADASALTSAGDKVELGSISVEEVYRLAGKLLQLDLSSDQRAEPGLIIHRGDKAWRIAAHQGRLRVHKSMSLFDDFWTADSVKDLDNLPPFRGSTATNPSRSPNTGPKRFQTLRAVAEVAGLFVVALVLVAVGLRFGLPQKRLSDLPPDVIIVTSADERASVFATVAGSYSTDKKPGSTLVTVSPDGQVSLGTIGKDGKPTTPRIQEQARAGRQGNIACVVTSFGVIAGIAPPDSVKVGKFQYKKAPESGL